MGFFTGEIRLLALVSLAMLGMGAALLWQEFEAREGREQLSAMESAYRLRDALSRIRYSLDHTLSTKRGHLITGDPLLKEQSLAERTRLRDQVRSFRRQTATSAELAPVVAEIDRLLVEQEAVSDALLAAYATGGIDAAAQMLSHSSDPDRHARITGLIEDGIAHGDRSLAAHRQELNARRSRRRMASLTVSVLAAGTCIVSVALLAVRLGRRRRDMEEVRSQNNELERQVAVRTQQVHAAMRHLSEAQSIARLGHWHYDLEARVATWSDQMYPLAGRDRAAGPPSVEWFLGRVHPDDRAIITTSMGDLINQLATRVIRYRLTNGAGTLRWCEARLRPVTDTRGRCVAMEGTLQDIDDLVKIEEDLRTTNATLESKVAERTQALASRNQALETFTYSVSHDLKAPLRGIDGYGRLLETEKTAQLDEDGRLFVANIRAAAKQMGQLIDDLLAYSRLERRTVQRVPVRIDRLVADLVGSFRRDPALNATRFILDLEPVETETDAEGLAMALRNLVDNAVKFTREREAPTITITSRSTDAGTTVQVADNGIGFDDRYRERIFDIFQRLHPGDRFPGTGIGLAIVRKAMDLVGGTCEAHGVPGQGATFTLFMPTERRTLP